MNIRARRKRLVENEVIFRDVNKNIQEFVDQEGKALVGKTVPFYCECSRPDCIDRINLTPKEYEELHKTKKHFVTLVGHEFTEVEKIVSKKNSYQMVKKHFTPPKAKDIDLALNEISSSAVSA